MEIHLILAQKKIGYSNIDKSFFQLNESIKKLIRHDNIFVLLPELWPSGFNQKNLTSCANLSEILLSKLQELAKETKINIAGTFPFYSQEDFSKLYNNFILIDKNGKIKASYKKMHLFPLTLEPNYFLKGKFPIISKLDKVNIGFATCYDIRFPELFRFYAINNVHIVFVSACFPKPRLNDWRVLLQARAIENQLFIVAVNAVGEDIVANKKLRYFGHSMVIHPNGEIISELKVRESVLPIKINSNDVHEVRKNIKYLDDIRYDFFYN